MQANNAIKHLKNLLKCSVSIVLLFACIEEYNPDLDTPANLLVIDGSIIKGDTVQKITITRSTSVYHFQLLPVSGCNVMVYNNNGETFRFTEHKNGEYRAAISQKDLAYNTEYFLYLQTPDGNEYRSEGETINESSPIDSLYYEISDFSSSTDNYIDGLQFYADLKASQSQVRNYRWVVEESWEYHSSYRIAGYWDAQNKSYTDWFRNISSPPNDTFRYCYATKIVPEVYTSTTASLSLNEKKKNQLNYVPLVSNKMKYNYSVLLKQFALSENAYVYWNQNRIQNNNSDGLYQTQPSQTKSNIYNVNNPDEIVLGYFWASSYSEKRIVLDKSFSYEAPICDFDTITNMNMIISSTFIALIEPGGPILGYTKPYCVDCREKGGSIKKPDFFK